MTTITETYIKRVIPEMEKEFGYKNRMAVPRIAKVTVNTGIGRYPDEKQREEIVRAFTKIAGQKPVARLAKKSIASFKTRQGQLIGYSATLRGKRMYDFLSRFVGVALPRTRDFKGLSPKSFDGKGNLTVGVKEHIVFPEMIGEDVRFLFGLEVTITTTAKSKAEGVALLKHLGFPIQEE